MPFVFFISTGIVVEFSAAIKAETILEMSWSDKDPLNPWLVPVAIADVDVIEITAFSPDAIPCTWVDPDAVASIDWIWRDVGCPNPTPTPIIDPIAVAVVLDIDRLSSWPTEYPSDELLTPIPTPKTTSKFIPDTVPVAVPFTDPSATAVIFVIVICGICVDAVPSVWLSTPIATPKVGDTETLEIMAVALPFDVLLTPTAVAKTDDIPIWPIVPIDEPFMWLSVPAPEPDIGEILISGVVPPAIPLILPTTKSTLVIGPVPKPSTRNWYSK